MRLAASGRISITFGGMLDAHAQHQVGATDQLLVELAGAVGTEIGAIAPNGRHDRLHQPC